MELKLVPMINLKSAHVPHLQRSRQRFCFYAVLGDCWCLLTRLPGRFWRCHFLLTNLRTEIVFRVWEIYLLKEDLHSGGYLFPRWIYRCRRLCRHGSYSFAGWGCCPFWSTLLPWRYQRFHCPRWNPNLKHIQSSILRGVDKWIKW